MDDTPTPIAEIDHGPSKFELFLEENQKLLIILALAIFLGVIGYVGYTGFEALKATKGGEALVAANSEPELQKVVSEHSGTASAGSATLLLAQIKGESSTADAISELNNFIASNPKHPAIPTATTSLGLRLINENKLDEAEAHLNSVLGMDDAEYIIPSAKLGLADIAQARGQLDQARTYYTEISDLVGPSATAEDIDKFSRYKSIADERLRLLGAAAPTEVDAKPQAPATPAQTTPTTLPAAPEKTEPEATPEAPEAAETPAAPAAPAATEPTPASEKQPTEEKSEKNSQPTQ